MKMSEFATLGSTTLPHGQTRHSGGLDTGAPPSTACGDKCFLCNYKVDMNTEEPRAVLRN